MWEGEEGCGRKGWWEGRRWGSGSWEGGEMEEVVRRQIEVRGEKGVTGEKMEDRKRWGERTRW